MTAGRASLGKYAQLGMLVNAVLAVVKGVAGILGNSYALVADAVESSADIFSSIIVWSGLRIASRDADEQFHFGYGKAEALAASVVSLFLIGAAVGIAIEAVREIGTPHHAPAPFTLGVLIVVVFVKEVLFRRVIAAGDAAGGSTALTADAWHHRSDAITSVAAFIGISVALIGGPGWEQADDWAALSAGAVIFYSGIRTLRPAIAELMDRVPAGQVSDAVAGAVRSIPDVRGFHALKIRRAGGSHFVAVDVQVDPAMSLHDAHIVSGKVKGAIRGVLKGSAAVLVHIEPDERRTEDRRDWRTEDRRGNEK